MVGRAAVDDPVGVVHCRRAAGADGHERQSSRFGGRGRRAGELLVRRRRGARLPHCRCRLCVVWCSRRGGTCLPGQTPWQHVPVVGQSPRARRAHHDHRRYRGHQAHHGPRRSPVLQGRLRRRRRVGGAAAAQVPPQPASPAPSGKPRCSSRRCLNSGHRVRAANVVGRRRHVVVLLHVRLRRRSSARQRQLRHLLVFWADGCSGRAGGGHAERLGNRALRSHRQGRFLVLVLLQTPSLELCRQQLTGDAREVFRAVFLPQLHFASLRRRQHRQERRHELLLRGAHAHAFHLDP